MPSYNPLADHLFWPTMALLAALLGGAYGALLLVMRGDRARLRASVLYQRWRVWAIIAPLYSLAIFGGTLPTLALLTFLTYQGLREYATLVGLPTSYARILLLAGLLAAPVAWFSIDAFHLLVPLLLIGATLQPLLLNRVGTSARHLAFAVLGWGYIPFFLAHFILLYRYVDGSPGILLAVGLGTAMSDVGAFVVGKRFGRHKLVPVISPNKTLEGALGNLLGAYLGIGLLGYALPPAHRLLLLLLPPILAVGAIWGDLLESTIKREFNTKDAGAWLPGFGGLLDRVDSLIIVIPLMFYFLRLIG